MDNEILDILSKICGLVGIVICIYKLIKIFNFKDFSDNWLNGIWLSGLIAFLIKLAEQLIRLAHVFNAVSEAKEPDINAIAGALSEVVLNVLNGLITFTILLILWGVLKGLITYKKTNTD